MTEPSEGHNSALTPSELRALHFHHFRLIEDQKAEVKAAQTVLKTLRKTAKADGCVMADLDYMARCADLEDASIVPEEIRRRAEIASWFALPVNYQSDMFADRTPIDDRAYEEGRVAGLSGKNCETVYDGKVGQRWIEGWHEGQRLMREDLQSAMEKLNTAAAANAPASEDEEAGDDVVGAVMAEAEG